MAGKCRTNTYLPLIRREAPSLFFCGDSVPFSKAQQGSSLPRAVRSTGNQSRLDLPSRSRHRSRKPCSRCCWTRPGTRSGGNLEVPSLPLSPPNPLHTSRKKSPGSSWLEDPRAWRALPQISSWISVDDVFLFDQYGDLVFFVDGHLDEAATNELPVKDQIGDSILEMIFEHST